MNTTIGFIGCGNMGGALAKACAKARARDMLLTDFDAAKAAALAADLGCGTAAGNEALAEQSGWLFLGVKPQIMPGMLGGIAPVLAGRKDRFILITMAAGLSMARIRELAGGDYPIIRLMPNTPASIGEGMILVCSDGVTEEELQEFLTFMRAAGRFDRLPENLIDAGCAVSGCGPAYVYLVIEALADGAVACGLPRVKAQEYAAQTLVGAAKLVLESGKHPGELKDAVCSPGGSTIQGVRRLEEGSLRADMMDAVIAAYNKTLELGRK